MDNERIFLGTQEICGILEKLNAAYSQMGIESDVFCLEEYAFADSNSKEYNNPILIRYMHLTQKIHNYQKQNKIILMRIFQLIQALEILKIFVYVLRQYTCFIFLFSRSLFSWNPYLSLISFVEFFILKIFKKKVLVMCCGSDSRPPYCGRYEGNIKKLKKTTKNIFRKIHMMEKYAVLIDGPASAFFHEKPFISYNCIGNIVNEEICEPIKREGDDVIIFHAPSSPQVKGTDFIRKVIEELKLEGYKLQYVEMTGVPHNIIMKQMSNSDILVDEMYSDFPMTMLDAEAAINGVPVITCGYYAKYYQQDMPEPIPPTCYIEPKQLKQNLIELINEPEKRKKIGEVEKKFVEKNWVTSKVAVKLLKALNGDIPNEWYYYPEKSRYLWGAACSKERTRERVFYLIENYGYKSLCLESKPQLLKEYIKIYNNMKEGKNEIYEQ